MDDRLLDDQPREPLERLGLSAAILFHMPGLAAWQEDVAVSGIRLASLRSFQWQLLEKTWVVDVYGDYYRAAPRFFAVFPVEPEDVRDAGRFSVALATCAARLSDFVLAARLAQDGTLINANRLVVYGRAGGLNMRMVGLEQYRLFAASFGAPLQLPAKQRTFGKRATFSPGHDVPVLAERGVVLDAITLARIEANMSVLHAARPALENVGLDTAIRSFTVGHDVFLRREQRLVALFAAFETIFGEFGPWNKSDLGRSAATLLALIDERWADRVETARLIEGPLRDARNAVAHGDVLRAGVDLGEAERHAARILCTGLERLLVLAAAKQIAGKADFRKLLRGAAAGEAAATAVLRPAPE